MTENNNYYYYFKLYEFLKQWIQVFVGKLKNRSFCWFLAAIFVPLKGTPTWCLHITNMVSPYKLNEFKWNIFLNILGMKYCADPILGKAFCTFTFFHFPDFRLSVLNCVHFYFWWRDSENREYRHFTVADPDLQIRGRPGHPDPKIRGVR